MHRTLKQVQRRLLAHAAGQFALRGAFYAACAGGAVVLGFKFYPFDVNPLPVALWAIAAAALVAGACAHCVRPTIEQAAVETDIRAGLAERLSTALTLADQAESNPVVQAVQRDAQARAGTVDVRQHFPFEWPWEGRYLAIPIVALLVVHFALPDIDPWGRKAAIRERKDREALLAKQAAKLAQLKRKVVKGTTGKDRELEKIEQEFDQLAEELKTPGMTKPRAMAKLSKLADALERRRKNLGKQAAPKLPRALERRLKIAKKIAEAMNKDDLKDAAEQLKDLAQKLNEGKLDKGKLEQLKQELKDMADALQKTNPELAKALKQAAQQLTAEDVAKAAQKLADAGMKMEELQEMLKQMQDMEQALAQVAKLQKQLGHHKHYTRCRGCGKPLHCNNPLCDAAAGGECPSGKQCPFESGFCPECTALGAAIAMMGQGQGGGKGKGKGGKGGGMHGPGRGKGGDWGELPDVDVDFQATKIKGMRSKAKPLGVYFTRGAGKAGKAKAQAVEVVREFRAAAEEALVKERIPQGHKDYIRKYFDTIQPEKKEGEGK